MEPGPSINETYWKRLGELTTHLMTTHTVRPELVGEARGIAWCLAVMANPYDPNPDDIRHEAMRRYHEARG